MSSETGRELLRLLTVLAVAGAMTVLLCVNLSSGSPLTQAGPASPTSGNQLHSNLISQSQTVLVDDFVPQPYQCDTAYYYNRLGSDRGELQHTTLDQGQGQVTVMAV